MSKKENEIEKLEQKDRRQALAFYDAAIVLAAESVGCDMRYIQPDPPPVIIGFTDGCLSKQIHEMTKEDMEELRKHSQNIAILATCLSSFAPDEPLCISTFWDLMVLKKREVSDKTTATCVYHHLAGHALIDILRDRLGLTEGKRTFTPKSIMLILKNLLNGYDCHKVISRWGEFQQGKLTTKRMEIITINLA
jgi:hypothetical protein